MQLSPVWMERNPVSYWPLMFKRDRSLELGVESQWPWGLNLIRSWCMSEKCQGDIRWAHNANKRMHVCSYREKNHSNDILEQLGCWAWVLSLSLYTSLVNHEDSHQKKKKEISNIRQQDTRKEIKSRRANWFRKDIMQLSIRWQSD